jgi:fumarate hydratase class II
MNVTALAPKIGYEKSAQVAQYAYKNNMTLKQAATTLKYITEDEFDTLVVFNKMI